MQRLRILLSNGSLSTLTASQLRSPSNADLHKLPPCPIHSLQHFRAFYLPSFQMQRPNDTQRCFRSQPLSDKLSLRRHAERFSGFRIGLLDCQRFRVAFDNLPIDGEAEGEKGDGNCNDSQKSVADWADCARVEKRPEMQESLCRRAFDSTIYECPTRRS
mmetsp:Transcript_19726/g.41103  ORF Transcript_19726/g.41103 Transcript_19726/m.41103 type:complete len:160 (+) Transcript_19726:626-1105(+)